MSNTQQFTFQVIVINFDLLYIRRAMPAPFRFLALARILLGMHPRRLKIHPPFNCKPEIDVSAAMLYVPSSQWRRWEGAAWNICWILLSMLECVLSRNPIMFSHVLANQMCFHVADVRGDDQQLGNTTFREVAMLVMHAANIWFIWSLTLVAW